MDRDEILIIAAIGVGLVGAYLLFSQMGATGGTVADLPDPIDNTMGSDQSNTETPPNSGGGLTTNPTPVANSRDVEILAKTIYGEARNQSDDAMRGVASVVLNRFHGHDAGSIADVCLKPRQFQAWQSPVNLIAMNAASPTNPAYARCLSIAQAAVAGTLPDNTGGAWFYYSPPVVNPPKSWGAVTFTKRIGAFSFFRRGSVLS